MIDALFRLTYFLGHRCARVVWRFTSPKVRGALVAVWHDGRVMLVRNSYRAEWSFPGGGIAAGESPLEAAGRELWEELGWTVEPADLHPAGSIELRFHNRSDHVTFFRLDVPAPPENRIDRREVVETRFFTPQEALRLPLLPHIRQLLEGRLPPA